MWSVTIELARQDGDVRVPVHRTDALARRLSRHLEANEQMSDAFVMVEPDRVGAQFAVNGDDPTKVTTQSLDLFKEAAEDAKLPPWPVVVVQALAEDPHLKPIVGSSEAARMLAVSRQRIAQLAQRSDFPTPWATVAATPVWLRTQIRRFERRWPRRNGRPPKDGGTVGTSDHAA